MPIDFPVLNFQAIAPELVVVVTAFLVMFAELFVDDKRILGYISILGLAMAAILNFALMAAFAPRPFKR